MVDFGLTRDHLRQLVHQVLQVFPHGDRALVVEPELSPLLSTVAGVYTFVCQEMCLDCHPT